MDQIDNLLLVFSRFTWQSAVDVLLVGAIFFGLFRLLQGTQAIQLIRGILILLLAYALATTLIDLPAFSWLMRTFLPALLVSIPIIFQPELRRALERIGRTGPLLIWPARGEQEPMTKMVDQLVEATVALSEKRHGAIIVLEGTTGLQEYVERGVQLQADVTAELLLTIFYPGTTLHDGAVIIREGRIAAAGCVLPLSQRTLADVNLGTRHRAALGISEQTDCLVIVVSEETGIISVARSGRMVRRLDERQLNRILTSFFV